MTLRLGDTAPDFTADSTAGPIKFHEWTGTFTLRRSKSGFRRATYPSSVPYLRLTPSPDR